MRDPRTLSPPSGRAPRERTPAAPITLLAALALLFALALCSPGAARAADRCAGAPQCRDLGPFTATVVQVNVTRSDRTTAYQGVRTTVRFTNVSSQPLVLGWRDRSSAVTDDQGNAYRWASKAEGIGVVSRGVADPQFRLAPGESRDAVFEGVLQYSLNRRVAGRVFTHEIGIVQLAVLNERQVRPVRDHVVSFSGLTATSGYRAGVAGGMASAGMAPPPAPTPTPTPFDPSGAPAAPPAPTVADAGDCPAGWCQHAGPVQARVVRVTVSKSSNVTAYQGVRTSIRFTNTSDRPIILAYRNGSGSMSDETGQAYRWSFKAQGIGLVDRGVADPQFRLAPGESREAAFEGVLQYSTRGNPPGRLYTQNLTIALLDLIGPSQVRTKQELAFGFSNLAAGNLGGGGLASGGDPAQAVGQVVNLLKGLRK